jgi:hypothetical protein
MHTKTSFLVLAALLVTGPALADATLDALSAFTKCADISDPAERLKCFDAAVPGAKSVLAPAPQPAKPAKEEGGLLEWFGLSRPPKPVTTREQFGKPPEPAVEESKELTEITAAVLEFARTPRGRAVFILENGQVWRQLDGDTTEILDVPAAGATKVTIEKGFLGSYNLTVEGRNGLIKVTRLK